jgi:hypothetical protein
MKTKIAQREREKIVKYRYSDQSSNSYQVSVVFGTNGFLERGAKKFFSLLATEMVSYGRISQWYFWSNILPDFMCEIDKGAHDLTFVGTENA